MKKLALLSLLLPIASVGLTGNALAKCSVVGTVVATEMDDDSTDSNFNKIFVRKASLANFTFSFTTTDQDLMLVAVIAKSSQMEVKIVGDASSCPGGGKQRKGGQVLQLDLNS